MKYTVEDILIDREKRVDLQNKLMSQYGRPLLCLRANYPGLNKDNGLTNSIIQDIDRIISDIFSPYIRTRLFRITSEGPNITMIIDKVPCDIKNTAIAVEDRHPLGRCIDIDVYDNNTALALSRRDMGISPRKCYLCDNEAVHCVRSRAHGENEIIKFIHETYKEYLESFYGKKL